MGDSSVSLTLEVNVLIITIDKKISFKARKLTRVNKVLRYFTL